MKEITVQNFAKELNDVFDNAIELSKEIEITAFEIQWFISKHEDFVKVCKELGVDFTSSRPEGIFIHHNATYRRSGTNSTIRITNLTLKEDKGGEHEEV